MALFEGIFCFKLRQNKRLDCCRNRDRGRHLDHQGGRTTMCNICNTFVHMFLWFGQGGLIGSGNCAFNFVDSAGVFVEFVYEFVWWSFWRSSSDNFFVRFLLGVMWFDIIPAAITFGGLSTKESIFCLF